VDKSARVWDVGSGQQILQLATGGMIRAVAFTPADGLLVTAGMQQPIRIWDAADGHLVKTLESNEVGTLSMTLSQDGRWMASGEMDLSVQVWSLPSGERVGTVQGHQGMPAAVAFSPGASTLVSAAADRTIRLSRIDGVTQPTQALPGLEEVLMRYGLTRNPEQFLIQSR
jgi:WD40 repeat protein